MRKIKKAMYETAKGLHKSGGLSEMTMREVEALCLPPVEEYTAKQIRMKNKTSRAVFASYLNTSPSTIQKWESGQKKPNGLSLKLLNLDKKGLDVLRE